MIFTYCRYFSLYPFKINTSINSHFNLFLQVLRDTRGVRREIILRKRAYENCEYIVRLVDVYVCKLLSTTQKKGNLIIHYR